MERKDGDSPWFTRLYEILSRDDSVLTLILIGLFFTPGIIFFAYFMPERFWEVDVWRLLLISATYTWLFLAFSLSVKLVVMALVVRRTYVSMGKRTKEARLILNSVDVKRDATAVTAQKLKDLDKILDSAEAGREQLRQMTEDAMPRGKNLMGELIMICMYTVVMILIYKYISKTNDPNVLLADSLSILLPSVLFSEMYSNRYRSTKMLICTAVICVIIGLLMACLRAIL